MVKSFFPASRLSPAFSLPTTCSHAEPFNSKAPAPLCLSAVEIERLPAVPSTSPFAFSPSIQAFPSSPACASSSKLKYANRSGIADFPCAACIGCAGSMVAIKLALSANDSIRFTTVFPFIIFPFLSDSRSAKRLPGRLSLAAPGSWGAYFLIFIFFLVLNAPYTVLPLIFV